MRNSHLGFTLLELLLVVSILAILGGGVIQAIGGTVDSTYVQVAQKEMAAIRNALLQYRQDVGVWPPSQTSPADFGFLLKPIVPGDWDTASARGYRGPYLIAASDGFVDIGNNLKADGSGSPVLMDSGAENFVQGIADPFVALPVWQAGYMPCDIRSVDEVNCVLDWRAEKDKGETRKTKAGRPYLLFDLNDPTRARLVSMGPDGRYAQIEPGAEPCRPPTGSDDLVLCLFR